MTLGRGVWVFARIAETFRIVNTTLAGILDP